MQLDEYVGQITNKPTDQQFAIMAFDVGVCGAPQPPVVSFAANFDGGAVASVRGPWMATSKSPMAQNVAVHTETMLINRLRGYLNNYIQSEGRRPYSLGLYSKFSPCRHCAELMQYITSSALPGSSKVLSTSIFGYADGFSTKGPTLNNSVGLHFFDFQSWYVDPSKHSDTEKKSWYKSKADALIPLKAMEAQGWCRFVTCPLPELHDTAAATS